MRNKKFDPETIVLIGVGCAILAAWPLLFGPKGLNWNAEPKLPAAHQAAAPAKDLPASSAKDAIQPAPGPVATPVTSPLAAPLAIPAGGRDWAKDFPPVTLSKDGFPATFTIDPVKGSVISTRLADYSTMDGKTAVVLDKGVEPGALALSAKNQDWKLLKVDSSGRAQGELTVDREFAAGDFRLAVRQRWAMADVPYALKYELTVRNLSAATASLPELYVWAGALPPVQQLSGDIARGEAHAIDQFLVGSGANVDVRAGKVVDDKLAQDQAARFIGVSNKFFACVLFPDKPFAAGNINRQTESEALVDGKKLMYHILSCAGKLGAPALAPGGSQTWDFKYYAGPKDIKRLEAFEPASTAVMHLAWPFIEPIAQWFLYALIFIKGLVGSYGWAIIVLTLIVKGVLWPFTHKANRSMKKMQKVQPLLKEIREKYKDNRELLNQKMMELYRTEKINPVGGCLPIFLQIPIFIALYWTLDGSIELRHASFLWAKDLTMPDTVCIIPGIGLPLNPFALMMAATMLLQQKMTPTAADPMQAKMMMMMPLVMLLFLYNLPSGLTLYWTVSQIISIGQLYVNIYLEDDKEKPPTPKTA